MSRTQVCCHSEIQPLSSTFGGQALTTCNLRPRAATLERTHPPCPFSRLTANCCGEYGALGHRDERFRFYTLFWIPCVFLANKYFRHKWEQRAQFGSTGQWCCFLFSNRRRGMGLASEGSKATDECGGDSSPSTLKTSLWVHSASSQGAGPGWPIKRAEHLRSEWGKTHEVQSREACSQRPSVGGRSKQCRPRGRGRVTWDRK